MKNTQGARIRSKKRISGIIGIILIVLAVAGIFYWEYQGREKFTYDDVIVMGNDVESGTIIKKEMLQVIKMDAAQLISSRVTKVEDVIGKQSKTYIPKGLQLSKKFFSESKLAIGKDEFVVAIPKEWIFAFPQTIRRGDAIYFHPVYRPDSSSGNISYDEEGNPVLPEKLPEKDSIAVASVAYVKDSANREVIDVTPDRMDASAVISNIEIIANEEKYKAIKDMAEAGYKFVLAYE